MTWTSNDIPDLTGRHALVTGANSGLGFHTTLQLARHGARVTMAVRDPGRGAAALAEVQQSLADLPTWLLILVALAGLTGEMWRADAAGMAVPEARPGGSRAMPGATSRRPWLWPSSSVRRRAATPRWTRPAGTTVPWPDTSLRRPTLPRKWR